MDTVETLTPAGSRPTRPDPGDARFDSRSPGPTGLGAGAGGDTAPTARPLDTPAPALDTPAQAHRRGRDSLEPRAPAGSAGAGASTAGTRARRSGNGNGNGAANRYTRAPDTAPIVNVLSDGTVRRSKAPSLLREPWRFGHDARTPDQVDRGSEYQRRARLASYRQPGNEKFGNGHNRLVKKLRAKAQELGLPVTDYGNSLSMAVRFMDGGRQQFLAFVELAAYDKCEDAAKFLQCYQDLRVVDREKTSFDLLCASAGVSPVQLLKAIVGVAFDASVETANLVAAAAHPRVVETTVRSAKRLNSEIGYGDRENLLKHAGFLPTPKGAVINVNATAQAAAAAGPSVPSFLGDAAAAAGPRRAIQQQIHALPPAAFADDPFADLRYTPVDAELVER